MSEKITGRLRCSKCGEGFTTEAWSSINVATDPELKAKVISGEVFLAECPHCGAKTMMQHQLLYIDPGEKVIVWLTDGKEETISKARCLFETELSDYTCRLVDDAGSLMEKVKIFDAGLDDAIMDMCKYVTRQEMGRDDLELKFLGLNDSDGSIIFAYPSKGKMEMTAVGFNVYEDCRRIKLNPRR